LWLELEQEEEVKQVYHVNIILEEDDDKGGMGEVSTKEEGQTSEKKMQSAKERGD
jgi:hypothetical protein